MPQLIVQPGLGDSLNRYLERLGRRGEEQRRLQQQRDFVQAEMDARASELRTRIISDSISQGVGLFTDEMQRGRASQRRMVEGDAASQRRITERDFDLERDLAAERGQLTGRPAFQDMYSGMGIVTSHNSQFSFLMNETGLAPALLRARRGFEKHPNELSQGQITKIRDIESEIAALEKYLGNGRNVPQGPFVEGMTGAIQELLDIEPSGPPKQKIPFDNIQLGTGRKSETNPAGNGIPKAFRVQWDAKSQKFIDFPGEADRQERLDRLWVESRTAINPDLTVWEAMTDEERKKAEAEGKTAPPEEMSDTQRRGWVIHEMDLRMQSLQAGNKDADDADIARGQLDFAAIADPPKLTSAFENLPDKVLDGLVKKSGGPIMLTDEQGLPMIVPNDDGQDSYVWYLGGGKVRLKTIASMGGSTRPTSTPPNVGSSLDSLIRP